MADRRKTYEMLFKLQAQMGSGYKSAFNDGQKSISSMRDELSGLSEGGDNLGGSLSNAFGAIKGAIVASGVLVAMKEIYGFLKDSTDAAIEFESAMTGVAKTSDMDEKQLAAFSEEIKELATVIPVATSELGNIAEVAGQLGIADDNLLEFTEIMAKLGTASTMTADEAATMLAQFANITQMSPEDYDKLGSVIVDLGNNFATTEQKITDMAQGIAAAGSLAGLSEADMMGLSAAVTSLGMETQAGSTAMSTLLSEINTAVETGGQIDSLAAVIGKPIEEIQKALDNDKADKNLKAFAKTAGMTTKEFQKIWNEAAAAGDTFDIFARTSGLSADEFRKAWGTDASGTLAQFITGLSDTERNGKSATLVLQDLGITEVRMLRMILSLSNSGDLMNRALATANDAWSENTALQVEAEKRFATTESAITMSENAWNNLSIAIGEKFTPTLVALKQMSADFAKELTELITVEKSLNDQMDESEKAYAKTAGASEASASVALEYISRLEELEEQGLDTDDAQDEYRKTLEKLTTIYPDLRKEIDLETGSIQGGTQALREYTEAWLENAVAKAYQEQLVEKTKAYSDTDMLRREAQTELSTATANYDVLVKQSGAEELAKALDTSVESLTQYIEGDWAAAWQKLQTEGYEPEGMIGGFREFEDEMYRAVEDVEKQQKAVDDYTNQLDLAKDEIERTELAMANLKDATKDLSAIFNKYRPYKYNVGDVYLAGLPGYASGLDYVPYDNFGARLHQGEQVLTASEARDYRGGSGFQLVYSPVINGGNVAEIEAILQAHSEKMLAQVGKAIDARDADKARRSYR